MKVPGDNGVAICIDVKLVSALETTMRAAAHVLLPLFSRSNQQISDELMRESARGIWLAANWFLGRNRDYESQLIEWVGSRQPEPNSLKHYVVESTNIQMTFIVLHEIYHVLCGHLDTVEVIGIGRSDNDAEEIQLYSRNMKQEFEADTAAVLALANGEKDQELISCLEAEGFFLLLDTVERISNSIGTSITHPPALDRLKNMRVKFDEQLVEFVDRTGTRKRVDLMFQYVRMFERPEHAAAWFDDDKFDEAVGEYVHLVTEENMATHVSLRGDCGRLTLQKLADLAREYLGGHENIHYHEEPAEFGVPVLPELAMAGSFVAGVAAIAALCVQLFAMKKKLQEQDKWTEESVKEEINKFLQKLNISSCSCTEIQKFDSSLELDGQLCEIILLNNEEDGQCAIKVYLTPGATVSLDIVSKIGGIPEE